ncbi:MAG TPA: outer membrane protein assembly factor BamC [Pseudomonas sabulinigri]|uniref:Outer membrane protein assembly factor BamC n=1 Tax=marine sediment metagenome TaxID=412755 RepID=A0A0F9VDU4_9ZZZZ|nr:outer membrane protein assembly factor BamC [Halopseudomonas sabulinigri]HEC51127.1 outer membrane protein assembly factor BamC [Halopseudomonas sabulinigri]|tara:strand:+ start:4709 stop:5869 length:1161 start_codon:yes stop_codon:yes gene_type:complete
MKPVLSALTLGVLASLSGCGYMIGDEGYFRDRGSDYQDARVESRMTVPSDLQSKPIGDLLPVPGQLTAGPVSEDGFETPRPQPLLASADTSAFSMQQDGSRRWLLAQMPASEVWPLLERFWSDYQVPLAQSDRALSQFATEWVDFTKSANNPLVRRVMPTLEEGRRVDDEEQRFRVRLEPGVNAGSSEVKVLHQSRDIGDDDSEWPSRSDISGFERGLLAELETYLNQSIANQNGGQVSSLANIGPTQTSLDQDGAGNTVLTLSTDFNRAWVEVGDSLARGDVLVTDFNRSSGVYYVDLDQTRSDKEEPGFFSGWFGGDDDEDEKVADENQIQVRLTPISNRVEVTVEAGIDKAADSTIAHDLLEKIQSNLNEGPDGDALLLPRQR